MTESYTFAYIMIGIACVMVAVTLVYVVYRAFGRQGGEICGWELGGAIPRIMAVARTTLAEGLRAKIASGFALIILIAVPLFFLTAEGDGTVRGRVQMFVSYSLGFSGFMLSLLTIFFACRSLSVEISSRQIYAIATKPIPRWQILAGKWIGIMFFDMALLAVVVVAVGFGTRWVVAGFRDQLREELQTYANLTPQQAAAAEASLDNVSGIGQDGMESPVVGAMASAVGWTTGQMADALIKLPERTRNNLRNDDRLRRQVLVARASLLPELPDLMEYVDRAYNKLLEDNRLPADWTEPEIRERLHAELLARSNTVYPGTVRPWDFKGPPPDKADPDFIMSVRFKFYVPKQLPAVTLPTGDVLDEKTLFCKWLVGDLNAPDHYFVAAPFPTETYNEFEVPLNCVKEDGTISVAMMNDDPRGGEAVFDPDGVQVYYKVGTYEMNLVATYLAILIPISCLASLGVCASTFLSFPVGSLIIITCFILSISMPFVAESFAATYEYAPPDAGLAFQVRRTAIDVVDWMIYIGDVDPVSKLIEGKAIGWDVLRENWWKHGLVKNGVIMLIGVIVLRRRELASVIV